MQNMILLLFAVFFTAGSYFILAEVFKVPTYRTSRAILPSNNSKGIFEREKAEEAGEKFGCLYHGIIQQNRPLPAHG